MTGTLHPTNTNPQENQLSGKELAIKSEKAGDELDSFDELDDDEPDIKPQPGYARPVVLLKLLPLGISSLTLLYLFHLGGQIDSLRRGHNKVLVQTVDGRSMIAEPVDNYVRTPATIAKTVQMWRDLTFNWVQKLPNGERDPGTKIGTKTFPTRLIQASTLMTPEVREVWYQVFQQRDDYLPPNFLGSDATRIFYPKLQTTPKPLIDPKTAKPLPNRYEVEVYGDWIEYSSENPQGKLIDRPALRLYLRSTVKTEPPLSEDSDSLQRDAYELRANGLEIYDIKRIPYAR